MVYKCGIPPSYFLDEMSPYEVEAIIEYYNQEYKEQKEWSRLLAFLNAKLHGTKVSKPESLFPFPWEKKDKKSRPTREEIMKAAESMTKSLKAAKDLKEQIK